ncbi:MAG: peroxidase family protein [Pseudomonadota bacterium]
MDDEVESYHLKNEGVVSGRLFSFPLLAKTLAALAGDDDNVKPITPASATPAMPLRHYCRLLPKGIQPSDESLVALADIMEKAGMRTKRFHESPLPAGYLYLSQFIDHDATFDRPRDLSGHLQDATEEKLAVPALDLSGLYLHGPDISPDLYQPCGRKFRIGSTANVLGLGFFANDLPRKARRPLIGDVRNDENLAVAQTHLAFMKFHNQLADDSPRVPFEEIRRATIRHYQAIVLHDFLPRICGRGLVAQILEHGRALFADDMRHCMPLEFSVSAFRMGHSMIRPSYEWNRIFNSKAPAGTAKLSQLFQFSGVGGMPPLDGHGTLPSNWIVDWRLMFDLSSIGIDRHKQLNYAGKMDAHMGMEPSVLPEFLKQAEHMKPEMVSLATRNLLRGKLVELPTGQEAALDLGIQPLSREDLVENLSAHQAGVFTNYGFDEETPFWYYLQREAMCEEGGHRLGPVGARIVAETLIGFIENRDVSVLREQPHLTFSMPELLATIPGDINPLGT